MTSAKVAKVWGVLLSAVLLLCLACGDDEDTPALTIEPVATTPSTTSSPTPTASLPTACPDWDDLNAYWPPQGAVSYVLQDVETVFDTSAVPFDQIERLALVCDDLRGRGQDAYIAYSVTGEELLKDQPVVLLAAFHQGEGSLTNLAVEPFWDNFESLELRELTGDSSDEVLLKGRVGARGVPVLSVWRWGGDRYSKVFDGSSDHPGHEFRNVVGDSKPEIVTHSIAVFPTALGIVWPAAYQWDGRSFERVLALEIYSQFIEETEARLSRGDFDTAPDIESAIRVRVGHAHQIQGDFDKAIVHYERAWEIYEGIAQPLACSDATQAVGDFYLALATGDLHIAYGYLGEAFREAQSFPDFAGGYAYTQEVRLIEQPQAIGQEGELTNVSVRVAAKDMTVQGILERTFSGVWHVRRVGEACVLESADIQQV